MPNDLATGYVRRAARLALPALLLAQAGCYFIAGVGAAGALVGGAAGAAVSITLDPPRDLTLVGTGGDTAYVRGARSVVGQVTAERGDTLFVALTEVQGARGPATYPAIAGPTAAVVRDSAVTVRVVTRDASRSSTIFLGAALGATAFITAIFLYCAHTRCLD